MSVSSSGAGILPASLGFQPVFGTRARCPAAAGWKPAPLPPTSGECARPAFTLSFKSHSCDGFNCDNWDVDGIEVTYTGPNVGTHYLLTRTGKPFLRFKADGSTEMGNPLIPINH